MQLPNTQKATKYEHVLPLQWHLDDAVQGQTGIAGVRQRLAAVIGLAGYQHFIKSAHSSIIFPR